MIHVVREAVDEIAVELAEREATFRLLVAEFLALAATARDICQDSERLRAEARSARGQRVAERYREGEVDG